jgi:hypothetical protein
MVSWHINVDLTAMHRPKISMFLHVSQKYVVRHHVQCAQTAGCESQVRSSNRDPSGLMPCALAANSLTSFRWLSPYKCIDRTGCRWPTSHTAAFTCRCSLVRCFGPVTAADVRRWAKGLSSKCSINARNRHALHVQRDVARPSSLGTVACVLMPATIRWTTRSRWLAAGDLPPAGAPRCTLVMAMMLTRQISDSRTQYFNKIGPVALI